MNSELVIQILKEIAQPLLILVIALFLVPPLLKRLRKSSRREQAVSTEVFVRELERVMHRANHVLDDPLLLKSVPANLPAPPQTAVLEAWEQVDGELKNLALEHFGVAPAISPYPLDYVLFELEMKKKVGNTALGLYRDLMKLKEIAENATDPENISNRDAARYALLARQVIKMMEQGPPPGLAGLF